MDTFLELNRHKLKRAFFLASLVSLGPVALFVLPAYFFGNLQTGQLLTSIILGIGIGSLFLILLTYLTWLVNRRARHKVFAKAPFYDIENIGFYKSYIGSNSKWSLTEEIREGKLNGFTLRMDFSKERGRHFIEFNIPVEWKKLDKIEFNRLTQKLKQHNIELRIGSLVKLYDTKQQMLPTVSELKHDLELFTTLLQQEGFKPKS